MIQQVYAQVASTVQQSGSSWTLAQVMAWALNLVLAVGFSLTLIMLAMGFVQYIMSQGDKAGVEKAQKWVTYAVIGGLGLFMIFALKNALFSLVPGSQNVTVGNNVNI